MALETGTYISDLVATNPVGATDPKSQGDDHIRLIKSTLKTTFPSITGAVTVSHTELNGIKDASNLTSGTLPDARLSSNVPLLDAANVWTSGSNRIANDNATIFFYNTANTTRTGYAQFNAGSASAIGTSVSQALGFITTDTTRFEIAANGNLDFKSGSVTTANDTADEVGFKGAPVVDISSDRVLQLSDAGKVINCGTGADDITVPANTFPAGTIIVISNRTGGNLNIIQGSSQTLQLSGVSGTTGNRTLAYTGLAYLYFIGSNFVNVGGPGVA